VRRRGIGQRRRITRSFRLSPRGGDTAKSIKVGVGTLLGELAFVRRNDPAGDRDCARALDRAPAFAPAAFSRCSMVYPDAAARLREILA
jgi:hypothetical protein